MQLVCLISLISLLYSYVHEPSKSWRVPYSSWAVLILALKALAVSLLGRGLWLSERGPALHAEDPQCNLQLKRARQ